ncbi:uncharacterized protein LOC131432642 [Malaya genurostris]|uniref:uncharacterized protein LOC131432642 n=1 Tax=Malaya genurostris TaxID=325434 RepID=UPI0026F3B2F1|nr:uncharacterized protein LOC131432642 [Malaya genurostris]
MTIYDPLGLIGNFLMYLKVLLQEIWRSGVGWDDEIPTKLDEKWKVWLCVLPSVEQVQIPRCYRQVTAIDKNYVTQLHIFVDASESGMAAVVYVRFEQNSQIECALVGSKTRVAPLRYLSIPRMELQAAVIGVRLADTIAKSHRLTISERFFWTDSRDVICWLQSEHRRYSQFVACRVSEILESSTMSEWRWISTKLNVADEGTKWQKVPDLKPTSRWFRGVEFLWMPMSVWPPSVHSGSTTEELRSNILHHTIQEPAVCVERFSKWKRLLRTVAYVKRFVSILRCKVEGMAKQTGPLTHEELIAAEWFVYSLVQRQVYPEEVRILADIKSDTQNCKRLLPKSSFLYTLCPVADDRGVLRVNGRINAIKFVGDLTKRPILLPEKNRITDLIIGDYHSKYCHLNHATVLNEIRQKYHIPKLRAVYNRVRKMCQLCKIRRACPVPPQMGELPEARLAAFTRPFSYTGIDYFGPMQVSVGRRVEKRWGVLLTCLTVRAVHIELAHSMNTDSCILALRNFIARRGSPVEIISDRGTNFIGANRELREALQNVNQNKLMEHFVSTDMKWKFNPPASPHFGGCWERLVQSVKKILNQINPSRIPSEEILRNMLIEIEMIINSRPLTYVPLDTEDAPPITPNHILLGSSNGTKPPIAFDDRPVVLKHSWKMSQLYADEFWKKWIAEYLPTLTRRSKWYQPVKPIEEGDTVVIVDNNLPRCSWPKGRVVSVVRSTDGQVRRATVQTAHGLYERPAVKIAVLDVGSNASKSNE